MPKCDFNKFALANLLKIHLGRNRQMRAYSYSMSILVHAN